MSLETDVVMCIACSVTSIVRLLGLHPIETDAPASGQVLRCTLNKVTTISVIPEIRGNDINPMKPKSSA